MSIDSVVDLWPDDFGVSATRTPAAILRQQAGLLGKKTNQVVEAEVVTHTKATGTFIHVFRLKVPALDNYVYELFKLTHDESLYPVVVEREGSTRGCATEADFLQAVQEILQSERVRGLVGSLIAIATS